MSQSWEKVSRDRATGKAYCKQPSFGHGAAGFDLRLLGPFEVRQDGAVVELGGPQQRAVLAHLALSAGRVVALPSDFIEPAPSTSAYPSSGRARIDGPVSVRPCWVSVAGSPPTEPGHQEDEACRLDRL